MQTPASPPGSRLASVDILRGIVMVIMVLDHVRDYFHAQALLLDPLNPAQTYPALYATRWITHFCAPVFVFLAGVSAWLQFARGKSRGQLSRLLLTRGLLLVALELTVISFGWSFTFDFPFLQVIWAIGWSMVVLAGLVWLPWRVVLGLGIVIVAGHNLLDPIRAETLGALAIPWALLHQPAPIVAGGELMGFLAYPLLGWLGVMLLGYGLGPLFTQAERARRRELLLVGAGLVGLFVLLRVTGIYGDPHPWRQDGGVMTFLAATKNPPSLVFVCMTLGPALMLLAWLDRVDARRAEPWVTFGSVPFFFYILHIYLAHGLSRLLAAAQGYGDTGVDDIFRNAQGLLGFGLPLWQVYLVWIAVVAALYLPCRWFAGVKRRHPGGWTSYL